MSERERDEQSGHEQHGRNGNVNHGAEGGPERPSSETDGSGPDAASGAGGSGPGEGLGERPGEAGSDTGSDIGSDIGSDELALRRMMRRAVEDIEPTDRALEHLRQAVPARRARKRQAVVGLAAAALFIGTAVPALVHVTNSSGDSDDRPSIAGNSQESQGGSGQGKDPGGTEKGSGKERDPSKSKDKKDKKDKKEGKEKGGTGGGGSGAPDPSSSEAVSSPVCAATQLGAVGSTGAAEANGSVYGSFRVSNTSETSCTIDAAGAVAVTAQGAADATKVGVLDHTAGDAAAGLPDPTQETAQLVLQPGAAYEVRFAWVPSDSCPAEGGDPSPNPTPTEGSGGADGGSPTGAEPQLVREDGGVQDGSVVVTLTAAAGSPSAGTTVPNACAGTVYRTGVLPAS